MIRHDPPICLDLFSGLGGWSAAFRDRGWMVYTLDLDPDFIPAGSDGLHYDVDILDLDANDLPQQPEILLASPPCNCFSTMCIPRYYFPNGRPKDFSVPVAIALVGKTLDIIKKIRPQFWVVENPRGMLRRFMPPPTTTTYFCCWGDLAKKPTDLWHNLPPNNWPIPKDWQPAPRGSNKGTVGKKCAAERAKIPYNLSLFVCQSVEKALGLMK